MFCSCCAHLNYGADLKVSKTSSPGTNPAPGSYTSHKFPADADC